MALSTREKNTARAMLDYYSGRIPDIPGDLTKADELIAGDEAQVKATVNTFIAEIVRPQTVKNINQLQESLAQQQAELEAIDTQIGTRS